MSTDYANLGFKSVRRHRPPVLEAFKGTQIVAWHGKIERQLQDYVSENVEARNHAYADKLRALLQIWRDNPLTGSINVEVINSLLTAAQVLAVDEWRYRDYFSNLRDSLRQLKASVEELPNTDEVPPEMRGPSSSPPSSFGPTEEPPPGGAPPGEEPGAEPPPPGAEGEGAAPGAQGETPTGKAKAGLAGPLPA